MLIKNARYLKNNSEEEIADILIEDGIIKKIASQIEASEDVIDAQGKYVLPGLVDVHVHFREPGFAHKETIKTGCASAANGGYTTVVCMPNLNPHPDNVETAQQYLDLIDKEKTIDVLPYATITKEQKGEQLVDFKALKDLGFKYFSDDGVGVENDEYMKEAFRQSNEQEILIVAHTEDKSYGQGVVHDGEVAKRLGVSGIPSICEYSQIERDAKLCQEVGGHYHVCHVSAKESVDIIKKYQRLGVDISAEVTPHHLLLTQEDVVDSSFKMNPPLRDKTDQAALIDALKTGVIDIIATDHAPHTKAEKAGPISDAAFGIIGLDHSFSLLYTKLVKSGIFTLAELIKFMSENPARRFQLDNRGMIKEGMRADLFIFDPEKNFVIDEANTYSKSSNTPFMGMPVTGQVLTTIYQGKIVHEN